MADAPSRGGVTGNWLTTSYTFGPASYGATAGSASGWFGPSAPLAPSAPPDVVGRQWDFPAGFNLWLDGGRNERGGGNVGFRELRALADGYDLLRLAIETRKDQLARMTWTIKSRNAEAKDKTDPRVKNVTEFFQKPDGSTGWQDWLRSLLEDLLVIDAPTLYMQRNRGGQLIGLPQIDGATIKPVIDNWGRTPRPYSDGRAMVYPAAYQQRLKGLPAVDYSTRDLIYRPRNRRVHTPFGFSPVEQIATTVNIALRRQLYTQNYFTEGSIPDSFVTVPETWTPDQISAYQRSWDALLSGNLAARRRVKFVPGGVGQRVHETKTPDLKGEFDEWLARIVCFAFSISPQALTKQMNRASAETQKESAEEEGLEPLLIWVKSVLDEIIRDEFGAPDLEFAWDERDEVDQADQLAELTGYAAKGILTINEARDRLGLDPFDSPEASQPMIMTATGLVPLSTYQDTQDNQAAQQEALAEARARQEAMGGQQPQPGATGATGDARPPQRGASGATGATGGVQKYSDDQPRASDGKWTSGGGSDASHDWHAAKDAVFAIAKGVAITAASGLAVALLPEEAAIAGVAVGATVASAAAYAADAAFYEAAFTSGKVILRHLGVNTAEAEEKLKTMVGLGKATSTVDQQLKEGLAAVVDHTRDEMITHLDARKADPQKLKEARDAIGTACDKFKAARLGGIGKNALVNGRLTFDQKSAGGYRPDRWYLGKRKAFDGYRRPEPVPFDRPATRRAEKSITDRLTKAFGALKKAAVAKLRDELGKVAKASPESPEDRGRRIADEFASEFDFSPLHDTADDIADDLEDVASDSVEQSIAQLGIDDPSDLVDQVNPAAVDAARSRAAELVGMKYNADGDLVPSDTADMVITDTTRDELRSLISSGLADNIGTDAIVQNISDSFALSDDRSAMIAATEVSRANSEAALASYQGAADTGVAVKKAWLVTGGCCDDCSANAAAGPIDLDDDFPSGDATPPGHPNCRCSLTPVVGGQNENSDAG